MDSQKILGTKIEQFDISATRGFLPSDDPLTHFPGDTGHSLFLEVYLSRLSEQAKHLPQWLAAGNARAEIERNLKNFTNGACMGDILQQISIRECAQSMRTLSFLAHAWVWGGIGEGHTDRIPDWLSAPLVLMANALGRPPVLSYDSYALQNWCRFRGEGPIALGNIGVIQNFYGGLDENWFVLVHVDIEASAGPIPATALEILGALATEDDFHLSLRLEIIVCALEKMVVTMRRMPEGCDPYVYFNRVRPYIHGWKANPALPNGVVYEGCFGDTPQKFYGETGAQSSIFPVLYALLGVRFNEDMYLAYLKGMRGYMPSGHRRFIELLEEAEVSGFSVLTRVQKSGAYGGKELVKETLGLMIEFLETHIGFASAYIETQAQKSAANSTAVGTGGTPFMKYLGEHIGHLKKMRKSL
ncbi:MAG: hypothetical protein A3D67_01125 [Candidatus Lloydbacteria bacterium RIFCSPHIGHO2_02_FULL_51_22]|uniref:Indoleamine 2,3-dioxygenase n=2 Tax=Candidatus Lloydiibacteriota TaxID=1817910 RepID=A0A1G2DBV9_9BACT|nr:MAG: hypothetical protein A3D67_01125 [Candidatus Lloydbacteria bacterium RIFCSPHIGHO2_02_FULL_51_22]OGZ16148.1 MAG: hypothetical protein A3G11_00525 [Candidatus Lloydbacteria bacterium RIFCSPLOWO2_12_FULL_51_9]